MEKNLSTASLEILAALRKEVESVRGDFGAVYLDNARPADMTAHQFAGHLSALEAAGLYRPYTDREFRGIFGDVKLAAK